MTTARRRRRRPQQQADHSSESNHQVTTAQRHLSVALHLAWGPHPARRALAATHNRPFKATTTTRTNCNQHTDRFFPRRRRRSNARTGRWRSSEVICFFTIAPFTSYRSVDNSEQPREDRVMPNLELHILLLITSLSTLSRLTLEKAEEKRRSRSWSVAN